jgi:hypothetical protein
MKVNIEKKSVQYVLTFSPESNDDKVLLQSFATEMHRTHGLSACGFEYLSTDVKFLVHKLSDDR